MHTAIAGLLLLVLSQALSGQPLDDCPGPETSTHHEACLISTETKGLKLQLQQKHDELIKHFNSEERKAIALSQKVWIQYLRDTCNAQQAMFGGIGSINYTRCENFLTKQRISYLESLP